MRQASLEQAKELINAQTRLAKNCSESALRHFRMIRNRQTTMRLADLTQNHVAPRW